MMFHKKNDREFFFGFFVSFWDLWDGLAVSELKPGIFSNHFHLWNAHLITAFINKQKL